MRSYVVDNSPSPIPVLCKGDRVNVVPIDQYLAQRFNRNSSGFIRSEVDAFEQAQNDSVAKTILNRIRIIRSQGDNRSEEEIFKTIVPNNYCSPAEFVRMSAKVAEVQYQRIQSEKAALEAQKEPISRPVIPTVDVTPE